MIPLVRNNYLRHTGSGPTFSCEFDPLPKVHGNYYQESVLAAEEIYALKTGPLNILYSGGIDSEFALAVFLELGMKINPVIVRLNPHYNDHDLEYAFEFCRSRGIIPTIIDIDFDWFVDSGKILEIATQCRSSVYHRSATAYAAGLCDGTVICGDGEPYIRLNLDKSWKIEIDEHDYVVYNYMMAHGIPGTVHFNRYRPEQYAAWITDPRMRELANNLCPGKLGSNSSKHIMYNRHSPFKLEERTKYTGYEKIERCEIFKHPHIVELIKLGQQYTGLAAFPYHEFIDTYV